MANKYNPDNVETDYINDDVAESQYEKDTKTHLRDVNTGIKSQDTDDSTNEDADTIEETDDTTPIMTDNTTPTKTDVTPETNQLRM